MAPLTPAQEVAERLLDAQVQYVLAALRGDRLLEVIARDVDDVLAIAEELPLETLVDAGEVKRVTHKLLAKVPPSTAASTLVEAAADVLYDGPAEQYTAQDLVAQEHVEQIVDELLALAPLVERMLDELAESPLVATVASRFVGRVVSDVLQANRAVAEKIPGLGSLVSLGSNAAGRVMGAADRQLEQLLGDTAGKGAVFAMRRLNRIVVETLHDPMLRDAVMEVWEQQSGRPVGRLSDIAERDDVRRVAALLQEVVIAGATTEPLQALVDALIDAFFAAYGGYPVTTLLEELEITRDDLVTDLQSFVPPVVEAARTDGRLEQLVRDRLAPFFAKPEVLAILSS